MNIREQMLLAQENSVKKNHNTALRSTATEEQVNFMRSMVRDQYNLGNDYQAESVIQTLFDNDPDAWNRLFFAAVNNDTGAVADLFQTDSTVKSKVDAFAGWVNIATTPPPAAPTQGTTPETVKLSSISLQALQETYADVSVEDIQGDADLARSMGDEATALEIEAYIRYLGGDTSVLEGAGGETPAAGTGTEAPAAGSGGEAPSAPTTGTSTEAPTTAAPTTAGEAPASTDPAYQPFQFIDSSGLFGANDSFDQQTYLTRVQSFSKHLLHEADTDGIRGMTLNEYAAYRGVEDVHDQALVNEFNSMDVNNDGVVEENELTAYMVALDSADEVPDGEIMGDAVVLVRTGSDTIKNAATQFFGLFFGSGRQDTSFLTAAESSRNSYTATVLNTVMKNPFSFYYAGRPSSSVPYESSLGGYLTPSLTVSPQGLLESGFVFHGTGADGSTLSYSELFQRFYPNS